MRSKKSSLLTTLAVLLFAPAAGPAFAAEPELKIGKREEFRLPEGEPFVPGQVIVKLRESATVPESGVPLGAEVLRRVRPSEKGDRAMGDTLLYQLPVPESGVVPFGLTEAAVQAFSSLEGVVHAEPNYYAFPTSKEPDDTLYRLQWHYFDRGQTAQGGLDLPHEWEGNRGSRDVVVAVIDTGILKDHPELAGGENLLPGYDMISDAFIANDGDPGSGADDSDRDPDATDPGDAVEANECPFPNRAREASWHGSHVAGTVGVGKTNDEKGIAGAAWEVKVLPVRVLGKCGGTTTDIVDAIRWAAGLPVDGVDANPTPARILNLSLGGAGPCSRTYQEAIDDVRREGAVVVVAAGNENDDARFYRPASCEGVITVAASDYRGHLAPYSNFGSAVEIMAPGGDVNRDDNGDGYADGVLSLVKDTYEFYNGTSMAAPHVAGVVALWLARDPSLTPEQIEARLMRHARARSAEHGCSDGRCGAGLLSLIPQAEPGVAAGP